MSHIRGFPPIARPDAVTLILGSMPSRESLRRQQYYAHPRNAFWPILSELFELEPMSYAERADRVSRKGIAIWDVLRTCFRSSSLDSDIDDKSITTNDFAMFYRSHPAITRVFFNGAKAESVYRRHVLPTLPQQVSGQALQRLPSTSPAHAGMTVANKLEAWRVVCDRGQSTISAEKHSHP
jgi:TDG/mug DNA glycosylase family protein